MQGDYQRAEAYLQHSLDLSDRQRDQLGISYARLGLGELAYRQGDYTTAIEHNKERHSIEQKLGNLQGIAHALSWLGWIYPHRVIMSRGSDCSKRAGHATRISMIGKAWHRRSDG